jgi:hypothetical protein
MMVTQIMTIQIVDQHSSRDNGLYNFGIGFERQPQQQASDSPTNVQPNPLALQGWISPQRVPEYEDDGDTPILIADQNHTVHAFNTHSYDGERVIVYRQWTVEGGWTPLADIILPPQGRQARLGGVKLDDAGYFHMSFFSGNDFAANVYYSQAPAAIADQAPAWSRPVMVGEEAITPTEVTIVGGSQDNLFIVYSGNREGNGLYLIHSGDAGETWTAPVPLHLLYSDVHWPTKLKTYTDRQGNIHATWSVVGVSGNGLAVYYVRLEPPYDLHLHVQLNVVEMAVADGYEADWPSIVEHEERLILVYQNGQPATRWMRISNDHGQSWAEPFRIPNTTGEYAFADFAHDGAGNLHMVLGNRMGSPTLHGIWHSRWESNGWSPMEPITSGPRVVADFGRNGFDPTYPKAVVIQGNVLLVTWRTDSGAGRNGIWYSYRQLDAPELPVVPLPTPQPQTILAAPLLAAPQPTSTPALLILPGAETEVLNFSREAPALDQNGPQALIFLSILPVLSVLLVVVSIYYYRIRNHR